MTEHPGDLRNRPQAHADTSDQVPPSRPGVDAVIFDMDGVLIDSEPIWRTVEARVFSDLGIELSREMLEETMGMRIADVVDHWFERWPWESPAPERVASSIIGGVEAEVRSRGSLLPGALEAIDLFRGEGVRLALASSSAHRLIQAVLERGGLEDRFEVVHSAEDEPFGKPHPGVYLTTAANLGVVPARCLAVEDSPAGVRAAKAAEMRCIAVPAPGNEGRVSEAGADLVLGSLSEIDSSIWSKLP